jgi:hypothetical protein
MCHSKTILNIILLLFSLITAGSCLAEEFGRVDDPNFSVTVDSKDSGRYLVEISNKDNDFKINKSWTPEVFILTKPTRLVIDIPGLKAKKSKISQIDRVPIGGIRTGVHEDKLRVVLDLIEDKDHKLESYAIERVGKGFVVVGVEFQETGKTKDNKFRLPFGLWNSDSEPSTTTTTSSSTTTLKKVTTTSTTSSSTTSTTTTSNSTTSTTEPKIIKSLDDVEIKPVNPGEIISGVPSDVEPNKEVSSELPDVKITETIVTSVDFESMESGGELMLSVGVDNLADYSLNKRKPTIYELVIKKSTIAGPQLTLPQFPPQSVRGIEGAILRTSEQDVVLKVYVEEGATLSPFRKDGKIWIKVN